MWILLGRFFKKPITVALKSTTFIHFKGTRKEYMLYKLSHGNVLPTYFYGKVSID